MIAQFHGAACLGYHPDLWFSEQARIVRQALEICATCPALAACQRDTLTRDLESTGPIHGVSGGLHPGDRTRLRKQARAAA